MRLLAIDTALAACSVAVLDTAAGGVVASESRPMVRGHAEALLPLVAQVMQASGTAFADLDRVAVTTGPGSFTGLRVGLAAARGFGLANNIPVIGVSTLSAYATPHLGVDDRNPVVAVIDARHAQVYLQAFRPDGSTLLSARIASLDEAARAASASPTRIVGSAAQLVADALSGSAPSPVVIDNRTAPEVGWVAQIGAVMPEPDAPPAPLYLRAPDAQPQNAASLPRR